MECADVQVFSDLVSLVNFPIVYIGCCHDRSVAPHNSGIFIVSNVFDGVRIVAEIRDNPLPTRNRLSHNEDAIAKELLLTCSAGIFLSYFAINVSA
jgi:hypothetical protein